jgi:hypothetical protein
MLKNFAYFIFTLTLTALLQAPKTPPPPEATEAFCEDDFAPATFKPDKEDLPPSPSPSSATVSAKTTPQHYCAAAAAGDNPKPMPTSPTLVSVAHNRRAASCHSTVPPEPLEPSEPRDDFKSPIESLCNISYPETDAFYERHFGWPDLLIAKYKAVEKEILALLRQDVTLLRHDVDPAAISVLIKNLRAYTKRILILLDPFGQGEKKGIEAFHILFGPKNMSHILLFQQYCLNKIKELKPIIEEHEKLTSETCVKVKTPAEQELIFWSSAAFFFEHTIYEKGPLRKNHFCYKTAGKKLILATYHPSMRDQLLDVCSKAVEHHAPKAGTASAAQERHHAMLMFWEGVREGAFRLDTED